MALELLLLLVVCAAAYACGAYATTRVGGGIVAVLLAALLTRGGSAVPLVLITVAPWAAGRAVRSRQQMVAALEARTRELAAEQDAFTRLAVRRERARIARELHDIVAHHLAVIVVQAGAGRLASHATDGAERLDSIRSSGSQALAELDRLVALLEPDEPSRTPEPGRLSRLLEQVELAGLRVRATPLHADLRLSAEVEDAAYRLVQEGLTNAMKHAPGSEVELRLGVAADALEVDLRDSGARMPVTLGESGLGAGLQGMRERVEALGGTLAAGPDGGGWRLSARLPIGGQSPPRATSAG